MAAPGPKKSQSKPARPKTLPKEHWKVEPDDHDYPAAADYLSLITDTETAETLVKELRIAPISHGKAKDLLRASELALLSADNAHVTVDLDKVRRGQRLSPVLLVRGALEAGVSLTIADGYHRICASYHIDENAVIPFRIVKRPASGR